MVGSIPSTSGHELIVLPHSTRTPHGQHLLVDLCADGGYLNDATLIERTIRSAVSATGAQLIDYRSHRFGALGISAIALLAESHMSVHTWPEHNYAAFDIFTCGTHVQPDKAIAILRENLTPTKIDVRTIDRRPPNR